MSIQIETNHPGSYTILKDGVKVGTAHFTREQVRGETHTCCDVTDLRTGLKRVGDSFPWMHRLNIETHGIENGTLGFCYAADFKKFLVESFS